jgi:hypothetical protein
LAFPLKRKKRGVGRRLIRTARALGWPLNAGLMMIAKHLGWPLNAGLMIIQKIDLLIIQNIADHFEGNVS